MLLQLQADVTSEVPDLVSRLGRLKHSSLFPRSLIQDPARIQLVLCFTRDTTRKEGLPAVYEVVSTLLEN